jgi:uroporphyrinogen-III decarboxylase
VASAEGNSYFSGVTALTLHMAAMTSLERCLTVIRGGIPDRVPVCLHNFLHVATHRALKAAGAHFTSLGDGTAGPDLISPAMFRRFARPYQERLVRELAADGIFVTLHICGNTTAILEQFAEYPLCGFELDYKTDTRRAKSTAGANHVLFGNVDPSGVLARGTPSQVRETTRRLVETWMPGGRFVLNAGCAIPATTPSENLHVFIPNPRLTATGDHGDEENREGQKPCQYRKWREPRNTGTTRKKALSFVFFVFRGLNNFLGEDLGFMETAREFGEYC